MTKDHFRFTHRTINVCDCSSQTLAAESRFGADGEAFEDTWGELIESCSPEPGFKPKI